MLLEGKVAVVTGGTRGIGNAIVRTYLREGAAVALCGSKQASADKAVEAIKADMPDARIMGIAPNLGDEASVAEALDEVVKQFGVLDIMVNNAGISQSIHLMDYTAEDFDKIMNINVKAVFNGCQAAARIMGENGGGVILNTSSMVGTFGQPSGVGYPASKFAVNGITRSLSRELGPKGIRVNAVAPGVINTDMVAVLSPELVKRLLMMIPMGRMGEAQDIANAYLFLASDLASYVSGAILPVDGATIM